MDDEQGFLKILDTALSKYFETYTATGVQEAIIYILLSGDSTSGFMVRSGVA